MTHRCCWLLLLAALAACSGKPPAAAPAVAAVESLRSIATGKLTGFSNAERGFSWLGIPYAAAPVGPLRWRAPQPAAPWSGVRESLAAGSPCVQYGWPFGGVGASGTHQGSEDCLFLNVYAPRMDAEAAAAAHLPVMVWVHGGSNTIGEAAAYDGSRLAATQHAIVVMINYRLGPFGWFVLPQGGAAGQAPVDPLEASGNWGLLDLLAGLNWVQHNVGAFGGDPSNVTLFGESAGATDALALLVSPLSAGLFHHLIIESLGFGFATMPRVTHYVDDPEPGVEWSSGEILLKLLVARGRAPDRAAAKRLVVTLTRNEIAAFLRALDPWELYRAYDPSFIETAKFPTVFQDGVVVRTGSLDELLADPKRHLDVPTILGTNRDEPKLFMAFDPRLVRVFRGVPLWIRDPAAYDQEARYRSMLWKANAVDSLAQALTAGGTPAFAYRFDWRDEGRRFGILDVSTLVGAAHGIEIPFVLGQFHIGPDSDLVFTAANAAARFALSDAMMSYWAEFAATGRPGHGRSDALPEWPAWSGSAQGPRLLVLDTPSAGGIRVSNELVSRASLLALMDAEQGRDPSGCAMFRATFRTRADSDAYAAWRGFKGGYCASLEPDAYTDSGGTAAP